MTKSENALAAGFTELALPSGRAARVLTLGDETAPPLVFLHSAMGISERDEFLLKLAEDFRVYAPVAPGFEDLAELDDLVTVQDVALHYDDILKELGLQSTVLVGHSFGGMFAAELAAHLPEKVSNLVLIAPVGLWNDEYPVMDIFATPPLEIGLYLWADLNSEAAQKAMKVFAERGADGAESDEGSSGSDKDSPDSASSADSGDGMTESIIRTMQGLITAGKYMMPIPDKGLSRRLYRISAPTLLIWGEKDQIVPPSYAKDFAAKIKNTKELVLKDAAHMVALECLDEVASAIKSHAYRP